MKELIKKINRCYFSSTNQSEIRSILIEIVQEIEKIKSKGELMLENGSLEAQKTICDLVGIDDIRWLSDGHHTFDSLYHQRAVLFATIVKQNKDKAWKSKRHHDGELCFGDPKWFIVGVDTPEGQYTYHYHMDEYWDLFDCKELEKAPVWDGHTDKDVKRLLSLETSPLADINPKELPTYKH